MIYLIGEIFALLTAVCWAQNAVLFTLAGRKVSSRTTTHIRLWIALPLILIVHLIFFGTILPFDANIYGVLYLAISGIVGFFIADLMIFEAFVKIGPRDTMLIMTLSPIFGAIFSWIILSETLMLIHIFAIFVTIFGISLVIFEEKESRKPKKDKVKLIGIMIALGGAIGQALGLVFSKMGLNYEIHPISANTIRLIAGFIGLSLYTFLHGEFKKDFKKMGKHKKSFVFIFFASLIGPVLGVIFSLYAVKHAPVGIASTLMQTSPIILLPIDRIVFKQKITPRAIIGTIIAVIGASMFFLF